MLQRMGANALSLCPPYHSCRLVGLAEVEPL